MINCKNLKLSGTIILLSMVFGNVLAQNITMNGAFKLFYPNTKTIFLKGNYKDSVPSGKWQFFGNDGNLIEVHNYKNGLLHDSFYQYYNKKILTRGYYVNNQKQGKWTFYHYESGGIIGTRYYKNDTIIGTEQTSSYSIEYKNGKANGNFVRYSQGNIEIRGQYVNNSREGVWYSKRSGIKLYTFKNNKLNDTTYYYYNDSTLYEKANYLNNLREGYSYYYRSNGEKKDKKLNPLWKIANYSADRLYGLSAEFYNTGDTFKIGDYKNGDEIGVHRRYSIKGQLLEWHRYYVHPILGVLDSSASWNDSGVLLFRYLKSKNSYPNYFEKRWNKKGQLIYTDTSYTDNKKLYRNVWSYWDSELIEEKHWINYTREGRWYKKDRYDVYYTNGKPNKQSENLEENDADLDFIGGQGVEEDAAQRIDNEIWNRLTYPYTGVNERKCPTTNFINTRKKKMPAIENIDSVKISGTVILEFFVFQNGRPSAPKFLKHLNPIADNIALSLALTQSCQPSSINSMEIATKYYLTVQF